jgi:prophage antirepressor-like protein
MSNNLVPFAFGDHLVRMKTDDKGEPWFVAKDVCDVLGLGHVSNSLSKLEEDEKLIVKLLQSGQEREMWLINESGLYTLIIRSNKPEAREFRKWITSEVLPSIRKTGTYSLQKGAFFEKRKLKEKAINLYLQGYSVTQIADELGVDESSIYRWKKQDSANVVTDWDSILRIIDIPMPVVVKVYALAIKKCLYDFQNDTDKIRDARIADALTKHIAILKQLSPNGMELLEAQTVGAK